MPQFIPLVVNSAIALAAPSSVALGASGAVLTGSALAVSQVVTAGLFIGGSLAASILARPDIPNPAAAKQTTDIAGAPRRIILGRARVSGVRIFQISEGGNLWDVIAHCQGPIDGIEEWYVDGQSVIVNETTSQVTSDPWFSAGSSDISIFSYDGAADQAASAELIAAAGGHWTTDHRLRGVAYSVVSYYSASAQFHTASYPSGIPVLEVLARGHPFYDPRDAGQDPDDATTWVWTDNAVLAVLWLMTADPLDGGWGMALSAFDLDDVGDAADAADVAVTIKDGTTERRSRVAGSYTTDMSRGDVLANVLLSTGTRIVPLQSGKYSIRLNDDNPTATVSIAEQHILSATWSGGPEQVERPNRLVLKHLSPERQWSLEEIPLQTYDGSGVFDGVAWSIDQAEITRVGERVEEITMPFCASHAQAARIARRVYALRRAPRGEMTTNLAGLTAIGHAHATLPLVDLDETMTTDLQSPRFSENGLEVVLPYVEAPTLTPWAPATDEPDPLPALPEVVAGDATATMVMASGAIAGDGPYDLTVAYTGAAATNANIECVYRSITNEVPSRWRLMTNTPETAGVLKTGATVELASLADRYEVRVRQAEQTGIRRGDWSNVVTVTP